MSCVVQSSAGSELQYIYTILRKLKHIRRAELNLSPRSTALGLDDSLFPRKFLLKLINERLSFLNDLATQLVTESFKQICKDVKRNERTKLQFDAPQRSELDEYFHQSFYHLHDFMIELDWYEPDVDDLSKSDSNYVRSKLIHVNNFLLFRKTLTIIDNTTKISTSGEKNKIIPQYNQEFSQTSKSATVAIKSIKPSISRKKSKLDSPRRRVRFSESTKDNDQGNETPSHRRWDSHEQSILALDLLIYALNLFLRLLYKQLIIWADSSTTKLTESLDLLKQSKRKLRTSQLTSISRQVKHSNDIYLTVLSYFHDFKNVYLKDYVLSIICSGDTERSLVLHKSPRINIFSEVIGLEVESKIISFLANQCLQLLLDLITIEINLPPVEFELEAKKEVAKSRENYLNFIASWLNLDGTAFGLMRSGKEPKTSTLESGRGLFKSSSRILAQMENLNEFMRDIFIQVSDRIQSQQQLTYFLELIRAGINQSFDLIEPQLVNQLITVKNDIELISDSVDLITVRIRCLKLIQILSSLDNQIKDISDSGEDSLETKLVQFARFLDD